MGASDLLHIRVGKEMKRKMQELIASGMFSTEAEIVREAVRALLIRYLKEAGLDQHAKRTKKE